MTYEMDDPGDVTLDAVRRVAWAGEGIRLSAAALTAIGRRRAEFVAFVEAHAGEHLYGITTKHDVAAKTVLDDAARAEFGRVLPPTPPTTGAPLPERVTRAAVLARLTDVLYGTAPLRPETAERLTGLLDGPLPAVAEGGNGDPGDVIALGRLLRPAFEGILEVGEGMALVNGSPVASAVLAEGVLLATQRIPRLERVLALAAVAAELPDAHVDPALGELWGDPHQAGALATFRELLDGGRWERRAYQAPVSFRSAPRVLGGLRRTLAHAEEAAAISLRSASNNPVYVGPDRRPPLGAVLSNGGYHDPLVAPTLDALTHAWADLAQLVNAQLNRLTDGLAALEPEPRTSLFGMTASGWAEQARAAAQPSLVGLGRSGQTDTSTPDVLAWRRTVDAGAALDVLLALLAVAAVHLISRRGDTVPPALAGLATAVVERYPLDTAPLDVGDALAAVREHLSDEV
ncbi:aromatic amino acid ammonia-lyase [Actinomycetospora endophytica]|uniref:Aromatic amino acid ammonia-lyase n=1 Tax=Actinomycetospora endophytica TaxID=2291215 RepID=A0ABS8PDS6_9PSEU|nr:aromatic amino acid lyase [Actinomycetospora endophytica]MCD2195144.1 aromatic amino acid ammonia-lyase [Actinomycetospora endophytica]